MSAVPPPRDPQEPPAAPAEDKIGHNGWVDLVKWCLSAHGRAAWVMAFIVVILSAFIVATWLLAPHVGGLLSILGGLSAGTAGGVVVEMVRRGRDDANGPAT